MPWTFYFYNQYKRNYKIQKSLLTYFKIIYFVSWYFMYICMDILLSFISGEFYTVFLVLGNTSQMQITFDLSLAWEYAELKSHWKLYDKLLLLDCHKDLEK